VTVFTIQFAGRYINACNAIDRPKKQWLSQNETFWKAVHKAFHQFAMQIGKRY
jgi:hypothetical protein